MRGLPWSALIVLAAALSWGCGSPFDGVIFRDGRVAFRVPERPSSWERIRAEGTALAFRDVAGGATIAVNGRCGKDSDDVPLRALTRHLFFQFTEQETSVEEVVPFDGREALHTVMRAKLDGVPKAFDVWVMKKDGCVYDLYLIATPERFDAVVAEFRAFVSGFATVPADG